MGEGRGCEREGVVDVELGGFLREICWGGGRVRGTGWGVFFGISEVCCCLLGFHYYRCLEIVRRGCFDWSVSWLLFVCLFFVFFLELFVLLFQILLFWSIRWYLRCFARRGFGR